MISRPGADSFFLVCIMCTIRLKRKLFYKAFKISEQIVPFVGPSSTFDHNVLILEIFYLLLNNRGVNVAN